MIKRDITKRVLFIKHLKKVIVDFGKWPENVDRDRRKIIATSNALWRLRL